ncbi:flagellar protein FlaG [Bacillus sp. E214]|uniref:flagellar protein FlaG n=1 Tax=Bacillus sp. E214 TaxID=2587156 RepID=UPI0011DF91AB|nr:flagellar protein FlaG [Bacillus sp. E214]
MVNGISADIGHLAPQSFTKSSVPINEQAMVQNVIPQQEQSPMTDVQMKEKLTETMEAMNKFIGPMHASLKFELHEDLNEYYVTVVDDVTGNVLREIPPKKMLDMYAAMVENMALFVDRKV